MQIPDDLSPPNEADAIRLPPDASPTTSITAGECLEAPPPFFGDSRPFVSGEDSEQSSRQQRREARRQARQGTPAAEPAPAPAESREPAPPADDRVIDN